MQIKLKDIQIEQEKSEKIIKNLENLKLENKNKIE